MRNLLLILALGFLTVGNALADKPMRFDAKLFGFNAGGAPVATNAQGRASVEVIDGGTAIKFKITVAGIDNLLMAHIHIAPEQVQLTEPAGPVAFWFVGGPPPGSVNNETVNGTLAEGYIVTDGDLNSWNPSNPDDGTIAGLITAISEGRASVVVHTDDLDPDTPTGVAGDSRAGELRGTLH
jgi:hypothetical protein